MPLSFKLQTVQWRKRLFHKLYHSVIINCAWPTVWTFSFHFRAFRVVLKIYQLWLARVMQSMMVKEKQINNFDQTCSWLHSAIDLLLNPPSPLIWLPFLTSIKPFLWPAQMTSNPDSASPVQRADQKPLTRPEIKILKFYCQGMLLLASKIYSYYQQIAGGLWRALTMWRKISTIIQKIWEYYNQNKWHVLHHNSYSQ